MKPPKSQKHTGKLLPVFVLLLFVAAVAAGVWWDRNSPVRDVRFSGYDYTLAEELQHSFELPEGVHPDSLDFREIREAVEELPYIRSSAVRMSAGGRMVIDVEEREPLALLADGSVYVDRDGVKLPRTEHRTPDLPLLHGFPAQPVSEPLTGQEFDHMSRFLEQARASETGWATLSEIGWDPDEGVIALTQEEGIKLIFGRGTYEDRLRYWNAFYREVVAIEQRDDFGVVDLRFRNQIVTR